MFSLHESLMTVKQQLSLLWSSEMVLLMFDCLLRFNDNNKVQELEKNVQDVALTSPTGNVLKRALEKASSAIAKADSLSNSSHAVQRKIGSPEHAIISVICAMYTAALGTLTQLKLDILTGLCYHDTILPNLWQFISSLGPKNGLVSYLDHLALSTKTSAPEFQLLILFCDCASHLVT